MAKKRTNPMKKIDWLMDAIKSTPTNQDTEEEAKGFTVEDNGGVPTIYLYDQIGFWGIQADDIVQELRSIDAEEITVRINSPGGSVFEGLAIYNILKDHPAKINVKVDGMAASIASVIMLAGDTREVAENGLVMIHRAETIATGTAESLMTVAKNTEKVENSILKTYAMRTGMTSDQSLELMSAGDGNRGTWMDAQESLDRGFATETTEAMQVAASINTPEGLEVPEFAMNILKTQLTNDAGKSISRRGVKVEGETPDEIMDNENDQENGGALVNEPVASAPDTTEAVQPASSGEEKEIAINSAELAEFKAYQAEKAELERKEEVRALVQEELKKKEYRNSQVTGEDAGAGLHNEGAEVAVKSYEELQREILISNRTGDRHRDIEAARKFVAEYGSKEQYEAQNKLN